MFKLVLLSLAGTVMTLGSAANLRQPIKTNEKRDAQILIELNSSTRNRTRESVVKEQNSLLSTISYTITDNYSVIARTTNVANVVAIEVPSKYVSHIRKLANVKDVNYNRLHDVKTFDGERTIIKRADGKHDPVTENASKETMNVPETSNEGEGTLIAILDSAFRVTHEAFTALDDSVSVKLTQAQLASVAEEKGEEFHAVVDDDHSCYVSSKVPFVYDYGGQQVGITSEQEIVPDWDVNPTIEDNDHGTHVASIAASSGPNKGIAPKAQLALLKVFTEFTPTAEEKSAGYTSRTGAFDLPILQAIEDSIAVGADMISMSLGSNLDDFDGSTIVQRTIQEAEANGVFVNVAAGNSGKGAYAKSSYEHWTTGMVETGILSSYANNPGSLTVASGQPTWQYYEKALVVNGNNVSYQDEVTNYNTSDGAVEYNPERHLTDIVSGDQTTVSWIRIGGYGEAKDYEGLDAAGKVAIVDRGETTFLSKISNAASHGALAIIIINNVVSETDFNSRFDLSGNTPAIPAVQCLYRDRELFGNPGDTGTMDILQNTVADNPTAYQISSYTSDGATYDLDLKPEITAPGDIIRGAIATADDAYDYFSGTSMATPNFSGAQALIIGEHLNDADYRSTINARMMSTARPLLDDGRVNHTSIRFQGAGMVDVSHALNSDVYLFGNDNGETINRSKIVLRNNEDIAEGNVKLSFKAFNESEAAITYTAKTYLYAPATGTYSDQLYPEFSGEFMSTKLQLLGTKTQSVTVNPGENDVNLETFSLTADQKSKLSSTFENGNYLEGFVVLETENEENNVNIPFLGFYGHYSSQSPVEPFSFEKEEGKTYMSDMTDAIAKVVGASDPHFGSEWVMGYWKDMEDVDLESVIYNDTSILNLKDGNKTKVNLAGSDPYTGIVDPNALYFGNNKASNTMIIQQYVNRSVSTNTIELVKKSTGETVLLDHMFDSLMGSSEEGEEFYGLYKSHVNDDYLDNHIIAHRAYTIIPLYNPDTKELYADGEYEMVFSYTLAGTNTVHEMSYDITIDSSAPTVSSVEMTKNAVRIRYSEASHISYVAVNGSKYALQKDDKGFYVDIEKSNYTEAKQTVFLKSYNKAYSTSNGITNAFDKSYNVVIYNDALAMTNTMSYEVNNSSKEGLAVNKEFTISVKNKSGKAVPLTGTTLVTVKASEMDLETLKVFVSDANGNESEVEFTSDNGFVTFEVTSALKFRLTAEKGTSPSPEGGSSSGCGGSIVASSILLTSISISLLAFVLLRRKRLVK